MKLTDKQTDIVLKVAIVFILYFVIAKPLFNFLGITKSKGDRLKAKVSSNPNSPFGVNFFKQYDQNKYSPGGAKITTARKKQLAAHAHNIKNAMGFWIDDEAVIVSAFHECKNQCEVSIMSALFTQQTDHDLFSFLTDGLGYMPQNGLSDYDMQVLIDYVSSLPKK